MGVSRLGAAHRPLRWLRCLESVCRSTLSRLSRLWREDDPLLAVWVLGGCAELREGGAVSYCESCVDDVNVCAPAGDAIRIRNHCEPIFERLVYVPRP